MRGFYRDFLQKSQKNLKINGKISGAGGAPLKSFRREKQKNRKKFPAVKRKDKKCPCEKNILIPVLKIRDFKQKGQKIMWKKLLAGFRRSAAAKVEYVPPRRVYCYQLTLPLE